MAQGSTRFCNENGTLTLQLLNIRSLVKYAEDIARDHSLTNIALLCFTETQIFQIIQLKLLLKYQVNIRCFSITVNIVIQACNIGIMHLLSTRQRRTMKA